MLLERKAYCHVSNASLSRLELIWLTSGLKMSKNMGFFLQKVPGVIGLIYQSYFKFANKELLQKCSIILFGFIFTDPLVLIDFVNLHIIHSI